jgi:uncharacterized protein
MAPENLPDHIAHALTNRGLKLILNTTEQCNLRCTYCYESFSLRQMPADVISGVVQLVTRRVSSGLDWLEIEFFGGEPLLAWPVVETLCTQLHEKCSAHATKLLGAITTNATLLNRNRLDILARHSVRSFQITVDGPRDLHDSRRVTRKHTGTFDMIWKRLSMLKDSPYDLEVILRVHFDASTVDTLTKSSDFLRSINETLFIGDKRFKLHFNSIEPWGPARFSNVSFFANYAAYAKALKLLLTAAREAGIPSEQLPQFQERLPRGESGHPVCYASRVNSFVIRSDGRLAKCTVAFEDERNVVGRITPGGDLQIDNERHLPWLRGLISGDIATLQCPAQGLIWHLADA